jgi:hypothetical protein
MSLSIDESVWNLIKANKGKTVAEVESIIRTQWDIGHQGAAVGYLRANFDRIKRARKFKSKS